MHTAHCALGNQLNTKIIIINCADILNEHKHSNLNLNSLKFYYKFIRKLTTNVEKRERAEKSPRTPLQGLFGVPVSLATEEYMYMQMTRKKFQNI